ncbi:ureidoglycolate lyase [Roseibium sediminicola]|uniref:Ureidoglycolate lyase n=1 Tax=Roseibium sediminicola TaxID=2933272 RepID=A0ABT0GZA6_9HYPH|nr:ureidoglycolate lyase [Roseibium sp. CAU 1639]MCK7614763.1 ureidoglycolate lyase [Roseibium sp. CAU 1639]
MNTPQYMFDAGTKPSLPWHEVPLVRATDASVKGYGCLVDDPSGFEIEITRWPQQGWRPIDEGTGDEGGWVEGVFKGSWQGGVLYGVNEAVNGKYVLCWSTDPQHAQTDAPTVPRGQVLLWHMNYHPDGGQLFFPLDKRPFVVPLALPGDNLTPDKVIAFWCEGDRGLYIHAGIWHEGIFPVEDEQRFLDRQSAVHALVSADIGKEFGVYLACPLDAGKIRDL